MRGIFTTLAVVRTAPRGVGGTRMGTIGVVLLVVIGIIASSIFAWVCLQRGMGQLGIYFFAESQLC